MMIMRLGKWFGNIVTLKSWEELWLNEGFANYFEQTKLYNRVGDSLKMHDEYAIMSFEAALERDSFSSTRPLSAIMNTSSEVLEAFDTISYDKGSAIIGMTASMIGEQHFRKALNVSHLQFLITMDKTLTPEGIPIY
ncbi:hypothetical protein ANCCAN_06513 [Ancylostoma caninum]|uniref:Peptidase M1 membrane alanine aminopeptidase domain-containing protein n=1 Tax=Ancylostoma caninum TaxID=29170 RepID=A0A368GSX0_ANCCA|nr:hypothetical protein ANCCAN_06513 [Ancylostoma caninum]